MRGADMPTGKDNTQRGRAAGRSGKQIGVGGYYDPEADDERRHWWIAFLNVAQQEVPDVLRTLARDVAPQYEATLARIGTAPYTDAAWSWREAEARRDDAASELPALRDWATRWNLNV